MNRPAEAPGLWWIQAAGKVWGPYSDARMAAFVEEGRVAPDTLAASRADGAFAPAAHQAKLARLFGEAVVETPAEPLGANPQPGSDPRAETAEAHPLLVWASLKSQRPERFEALLGAYGPYVAIQPGLWLVRARMEPAGLRNALTRRLDGADRLMVVAAPIDRAAWFNIDGETDRLLRQFWDER